MSRGGIRNGATPLAVAALAAAGAGALAGAVTRRRALIDEVDPELRSRDLWMPLSITSATTIRAARRLFERPTEAVPGVFLRTLEVPGGLPLRVYETPDRARPGGAVLWIHGGGYVIGGARTDEGLASALARDSGVLVANAEYRLAPEHPFPAALDDLLAALRMLHADAAALGIDPARIAIAGASAGGGLAAALAQRARDEGVPVAAQLLLYPMLDDRTIEPGPGARGAFGWTARSNRTGWASYLGGAHPETPYAVPARRADLSGLPPAWIGVGDLDLFWDEDLAYGLRLREAGVEVHEHRVPGMHHGADAGFTSPAASIRALRADLLDAIRRATSAPPSPAE